MVGPKGRKRLFSLVTDCAVISMNWLNMVKIVKSFEAVCDFMARDQCLESCRELYVHLKPKQFKNLDEMVSGDNLFAEVHGGVFSCVDKGLRSNKGAKQGKSEKSDSSKWSGKPAIKCSICGKGHLTVRCYKTPIGNRYTAPK